MQPRPEDTKKKNCQCTCSRFNQDLQSHPLSSGSDWVLMRLRDRLYLAAREARRRNASFIGCKHSRSALLSVGCLLGFQRNVVTDSCSLPLEMHPRPRKEASRHFWSSTATGGATCILASSPLCSCIAVSCKSCSSGSPQSSAVGQWNQQFQLHRWPWRDFAES